MAGALGFEPRIQAPKARALPLGHAPSGYCVARWSLRYQAPKVAEKVIRFGRVPLAEAGADLSRSAFFLEEGEECGARAGEGDRRAAGGAEGVAGGARRRGQVQGHRLQVVEGRGDATPPSAGGDPGARPGPIRPAGRGQGAEY